MSNNAASQQSSSDIDTGVPHPTLSQAACYWLKLGLISFGGPAGQISLMHHDVVQTKKWISDAHFLDAMNFCMLLPGPEAQQLATYLGWRLHGVRGGLIAGLLFIAPAALLLYVLSWVYMVGGELPWLAAIFHGLSAAVIAIVLQAVLRIGSRTLTSPVLWLIAVLAFLAIFVFQISYVLILLGAAAIGWLGCRIFPGQFVAKSHHKSSQAQPDMRTVQLAACPKVTWRRTCTILVFGVILWWGPVLTAIGQLGWHSTLAQQGLFFSKAALVTFGGAYAVLPYVAQQAVEDHHWLTSSQMMSGLALAETTPGPLIMVLQFVGFVGGWQHPGEYSPLMAATIGSVITTWVTFAPCFLFVFLGGPYVQRLGQLPRVRAALTAITAAVVGVIVNLAVNFGVQALMPVAGGSLDWPVAVTAAAALVFLVRYQFGVVKAILLCGALGLAHWAIRG